jgi:polyisoprenoid-binding protein YceI
MTTKFGKMEAAVRRILMVLPILLSATVAAGQNIRTFYINDETGRDIVTFTSKAPLETIVGKTSQIRGYVTVDPEDITGSARGKIEVYLNGLKTGISLRDTHMREQYLETDKYPKTTFEITRVIEAGGNVLEDQRPVEMLLEGNFTVHGVTRLIEVPVTAKLIEESEQTKNRHPGDLLHIQATFDVLLSDHNIDRPQFVFLKLDEKQRIDVDAFAATGLPAVELARK